MAVRTFYFLRIPNVGDRVNASLVSILAERPTTWVSARSRPHLLAAGSILSAANKASRIWGSGLMSPDRTGEPCGDRVSAVRGKLTARMLRAAGIGIGDVPLGDPGFLAPHLLGVVRAAQPVHALGLVPHYVDRRHEAVARLAREDGVVVLDVRQDPASFLRAMSGCAAVASSSLHGLIFAEALGIPSLWIKLGDDIAGGAFKYRDWFSTTANPQRRACIVDSDATVAELQTRCEPRGSQIDVAALEAAFPRADLDELDEPVTKSFLPAAVAAKRPVPAFLISFNRGDMLKRAIAGLRRLDRPVEIVVHDNGSTDGATLATLATLEAEGIGIARAGPIDAPDDLNRVDRTVAAFFRNRGEPSRYVVSDCDIDMGVCDGDVLDVYDALLDQMRKVECVGPMLRIRDIPSDYPLFKRALNRHVAQFWHRRPSFTDVAGKPVAYLEATIDTTFALHRAGERFRRLKQGIRCYEPYEALHLDWYATTWADTGYAGTSSARVSHWNNNAERRAHEGDALVYDRFLHVRRTAGRLEVVESRITADGIVDAQPPLADRTAS